MSLAAGHAEGAKRVFGLPYRPSCHTKARGSQGLRCTVVAIESTFDEAHTTWLEWLTGRGAFGCKSS